MNLYFYNPSFPGIKPLVTYYRENDLLKEYGQIPVIVDLVKEWFDKGRVPEALENIPCLLLRKTIR